LPLDRVFAVVFLGLIAGSLSASTGCREIVVAPDEDATNPTPQTLVVLGIDGQPLVNAHVRVSDWGMISRPERVNWTGETSEHGTVHPAVPSGRYWIKVTPIEREHPVWAQIDTEFAGDPVTLDPRSRVRHGQLTVPSDFRAQEFTLRLLAQVPMEFRPVSFTLKTGVRPDGSFDIVWLDGAEYTASIESYSASDVLDPGVLGSYPDSVLVDWNPEVFEVGLTLAGMPLPEGQLRLEVSGSKFHAFVSRAVSGRTVSFPAKFGPGDLRIIPPLGMPFLKRSIQIDFTHVQVPTFELGDHRVGLHIVDDEGQDVDYPAVSVTNVSTHASAGFQARAPFPADFFLRTGQHLFSVAMPSFRRTTVLADVAQDTTITLILIPESE
jgi:hypothetical protein